MQDGATCHTTENNLSILKEEFNGRIISNKTDEVWPPNIPDLNPLARLLFWGYIMQEIIRSKPSTIYALKTIDLSIDPDMIRKSYSSARRRFEMEILEKGGQFERKKIF